MSSSNAVAQVSGALSGVAIYRSTSARINNTEPQQTLDASRILVEPPLQCADGDSPKVSEWPENGGCEGFAILTATLGCQVVSIWSDASGLFGLRIGAVRGHRSIGKAAR
jgi:hypothetical protein